METKTMTDFTVEIPFEDVVEKLCLEEEDDIELMREKWREATKIARPKAIYRACACRVLPAGGVEIGSEVFHSDTLARKLAETHRVFAYVLTCGTEVDDWSHTEADPIVGLWLDMLKEMILGSARKQFISRMQQQYGVARFTSMNPGSGNLDTWPIAQQQPLFGLLGDVHSAIGVTLTESYLMLPTKSVSGVLFPSEVDFTTCSLCEREHCTGRKAPYTGPQ